MDVSKFALGAVTSLAGAGALLLGLHQYRASFSVRSWPSTEGLVTHSDVARDEEHWKPDVRYTYSVDGSQFESDSIRFGGAFGTTSRSPAQAVAEQYPAGETVLVFFDPDDPSRACLDRTRSPAVALFVYVGLSLLLGGAALAYLAI